MRNYSFKFLLLTALACCSIEPASSQIARAVYRFVFGAAERAAARTAIEESIINSTRRLELNSVSKSLYGVDYSPVHQYNGRTLPSTVDENTLILQKSRLIHLSDALAQGIVGRTGTTLTFPAGQGRLYAYNANYVNRYRKYFGLKELYGGYDQDLVNAVKNFQQKNELEPTGLIAGKTESLIKIDIFERRLVEEHYFDSESTAIERRRGIEAFQSNNDLKITGVLDVPTRKILERKCFPSVINFFGDFGLNRGSNPRSFAFGHDFLSAKIMEDLKFLTVKDKLVADETKKIIRFQRMYKLPVTGKYDEITFRYLIELNEIEKIVPVELKRQYPGFVNYSKKYISAIQEHHHLNVTGLLDGETRKIIRPLSDQVWIKSVELAKLLPDDFVNTGFLLNNKSKDLKFYFSDVEHDYFIIDNSKISLPSELLAWRFNKNSGEFTLTDLLTTLKIFEETAINNVKNNKQVANCMFAGFEDEEGFYSIQLNSTIIRMSKDEINRFMDGDMSVTALDQAFENLDSKPVVLIRPLFKLAVEEDGPWLNNIMGTGKSAINMAKFTSAINSRYGAKTPVFLASDINGACKKIKTAVKQNTNPGFHFFIPENTSMYKVNDYNVIRNLSGRGLKREYFKATGSSKWFKYYKSKQTTNSGAKIVVGHKDNNYKSLVSWALFNDDQSPLLLASCYQPGDVNYISGLISRYQLSNVIYFSCEIHPTPLSDVLIEYLALSKIKENKEKGFFELWFKAIEITEIKYEGRYSDAMLKELHKLRDNILGQLTFYKKAPFNTSEQNA